MSRVKVIKRDAKERKSDGLLELRGLERERERENE